MVVGVFVFQSHHILGELQSGIQITESNFHLGKQERGPGVGRVLANSFLEDCTSTLPVTAIDQTIDIRGVHGLEEKGVEKYNHRFTQQPCAFD